MYALTDCGKRRTNNEDFCSVEKLGNYCVMIIADGMGGVEGGELASSAAVRTAFTYIKEKLRKKTEPAEIFEIMRSSIFEANNEILKLARENTKYKGMGTTVDICVADNKSAYIAHIGDSRVYKISGKKAKMITRDHSLMEYLISIGAITYEESLTHPQRHMITRALGTSEAVEADTFIVPLEKNDSLLLCSDGLTNMLSDDEIASIITNAENPQEACEKLVLRANEEGGADNITVIVARK